MFYLILFLLLIMIGLILYLVIKIKKPKKPFVEIEGPSIYTHEGKIIRTKAKPKKPKKNKEF